MVAFNWSSLFSPVQYLFLLVWEWVDDVCGWCKYTQLRQDWADTEGSEWGLCRWEKPWYWVQQKRKVAMPQELSLDFLTSAHIRGISSGPCCLICCAGRRVCGCKRLDSVISLPTSGIAKQHKIHTVGNGPVSLSAENKLFVPRCSGCSSH